MPKQARSRSGQTPYGRPAPPQKRGFFSRLKNLFATPKPASPLGAPVLLSNEAAARPKSSEQPKSGEQPSEHDVSMDGSRITYHSPKRIFSEIREVSSRLDAPRFEPKFAPQAGISAEPSVEPIKSSTPSAASLINSPSTSDDPNETLRQFFAEKGDQELSNVEVMGVLSLISQAVGRNESLVDFSNSDITTDRSYLGAPRGNGVKFTPSPVGSSTSRLGTSQSGLRQRLGVDSALGAAKPLRDTQPLRETPPIGEESMVDAKLSSTPQKSVGEDNRVASVITAAFDKPANKVKETVEVVRETPQETVKEVKKVVEIPKETIETVKETVKEAPEPPKAPQSVFSFAPKTAAPKEAPKETPKEAPKEAPKSLFSFKPAAPAPAPATSAPAAAAPAPAAFSFKPAASAPAPAPVSAPVFSASNEFEFTIPKSTVASEMSESEKAFVQQAQREFAF